MKSFPVFVCKTEVPQLSHDFDCKDLLRVVKQFLKSFLWDEFSFQNLFTSYWIVFVFSIPFGIIASQLE